MAFLSILPIFSANSLQYFLIVLSRSNSFAFDAFCLSFHFVYLPLMIDCGLPPQICDFRDWNQRYRVSIQTEFWREVLLWYSDWCLDALLSMAGGSSYKNIVGMQVIRIQKGRQSASKTPAKTAKDKQSDTAVEEMKTIHSYFALLKHIFQKNRQTIRSHQNGITQRMLIGRKIDSSSINESQIEHLCSCRGLSSQHRRTKTTQKDEQDRQRCINTLTASTVMRQGHRYGIKDRHHLCKAKINKKIIMNQDACIDFTPIGDVYHQLKEHKHVAVQEEMRVTSNHPKSCFKLKGKNSKTIEGLFRTQPKITFSCMKTSKLFPAKNIRNYTSVESRPQTLRTPNKSQLLIQSQRSIQSEVNQMPTPW